MIRGEPVFQNEVARQAEQAIAAEKGEAAAGESMRSLREHPPQLQITGVQPAIQNDAFMRLWLTFYNPSEHNIIVDKLYMLGGSRDIFAHLSPHESDQIEVYEGPMLKRKASGYAKVQFKVEQTGDVFLARYLVQYQLENDGDYVPTRFELVDPVRALR